MRKRRTPTRMHVAAATAIALIAVLVAFLLPKDTPTAATETPSPPFPSDIQADLDGDGLPDTEFTATDPRTGKKVTQSIADLTNQRDLIRDLLAPGGTTDNSDGTDDDGSDSPGTATPNVRTSQTMLVPNTSDWWKVATSVVPELHLSEVAHPTKARWFSATTSASTNPATPPRLRTFRTLSIAFDTVDDAVDYLANLGADGSFGLWAGSFLRDTVLTFIPTGVDPDKEDYADLTGVAADAINEIRPVVGVWSIDYGLTVDHAAAAAETPEYGAAFRTYMTNLDYAAGTTWSGVATNPTGPWVGALKGFDPDTVDFIAGGTALERTATVECDTDFCLGLDPGISELPTQLGFSGPDGGTVGVATVPLLPDQPTAPMRFALNWGTALGVLDGSLHTTVAYYPFITGWVSATGTQTMNFTKRPEQFPG